MVHVIFHIMFILFITNHWCIQCQWKLTKYQWNNLTCIYKILITNDFFEEITTFEIAIELNLLIRQDFIKFDNHNVIV